MGLFTGTAHHYARYRPGYPSELIRLLAERAGLDGSSRVLDLGCGTGQIAIPLAAYAGEVVAADAEQEMLDELDAPPNVRKVLARAEEVDESWGRFDLVAIGNAFHWMEPSILDRLPTDRVALLNNGSASHGLLREIAGELRGPPPAKKQPTVRYDESLAAAGFEVDDLSVDVECDWSVDELVGLAFSTSWGSPARMGDLAEEYERRLRERLRPLSIVEHCEAFLGLRCRGDE
jgi:SAM-dependent methyltransferase